MGAPGILNNFRTLWQEPSQSACIQFHIGEMLKRNPSKQCEKPRVILFTSKRPRLPFSHVSVNFFLDLDLLPLHTTSPSFPSTSSFQLQLLLLILFSLLSSSNSLHYHAFEYCCTPTAVTFVDRPKQTPIPILKMRVRILNNLAGALGLAAVVASAPAPYVLSFNLTGRC